MKASGASAQGIDFYRAHYFLSRKQTAAAIQATKEELRYHPNHSETLALLESLQPGPSAGDGAYDSDGRLRVARAYTIVGEKRLRSLYQHAKTLCEQDIPGHFVECGAAADITHKPAFEECLTTILKMHGHIDGLINNAANNPKMAAGADTGWLRFENLPLEIWEQDLAVGLTGAFLCAQVFGSAMAKASGGAIVNIASDLSLIGPDQRLYQQPDLAEDQQPVKPVTYSVVKTGLLGLTRYLATYWAHQGVRVNAISPGGVANDQPPEFVEKLTERIPMGRMARPDEYQDAMVFLLSESSSYMTGANLVMDGGRTVW